MACHVSEKYNYFVITFSVTMETANVLCKGCNYDKLYTN